MQQVANNERHVLRAAWAATLAARAACVLKGGRYDYNACGEDKFVLLC